MTTKTIKMNADLAQKLKIVAAEKAITQQDLLDKIVSDWFYFEGTKKASKEKASKNT